MYDKVYKQIGLNIKKYRKAKGLTQELLAEKVDKSLNHLGKIEVAFASHPSLEMLIDIAAALEIPLKDLFDFDNDG